jgi:hypothetical protein
VDNNIVVEESEWLAEETAVTDARPTAPIVSPVPRTRRPHREQRAPVAFRRAAVPCELILFRKKQDTSWRYSFDEESGGEPILGLAQPGYRLEPSDGQLIVVTPAAESLDLEMAIRMGIVETISGYTYEVLKNLFQMAMHNEVRADLIFLLLRAGVNPLDWDLETGDARASLLDAEGRVRASIERPSWWRVHDPDFAGEIATDLLRQAGLSTQDQPLPTR